ncbi:MAG: hypothetical protein WCI17_06185 [bacterium]
MNNVNRTGVAVALLAVAAVVLYLFVVEPMTWKSATRKESARILAAAQTTNEFAMAVGDLGLFLSFPDGSWMAIRYRERHAINALSSAMARDSGGMSFFSEHHFCGYLSAYPKIAEMQHAARKDAAQGWIGKAPNLLAGFEGIHALATSPDLAAARTNLLSLGFGRMK